MKTDEAEKPGVNGKYAWRNLDRVEPPKRAVLDRLSDFNAVFHPYDEITASEQASRCVQCPNPNCVAACPLEIPFPELLALTADGRFDDAARLLLASHTLPEMFAHVCQGQHLCESACVLCGRSDPPPISALARFLLDY